MEKKQGLIVCDECGQIMRKMEEILHDHVIAQDEEGNEITETYIECPRCGHHYTVIVEDRNVRLMVQKRRQLIRKIYRTSNRAIQDRLTEQERNLHEDIRERSEALKKKYLEGGVI